MHGGLSTYCIQSCTVACLFSCPDVLGYPCIHFWLISEFKKVLTETKPAIWDGKAMTKKWAVNFCHRFNITTQSKNNIKETDQVDRLEAI